MIVLDASAAVDLLLGREPEAGWVATQILRGPLRAPHLIDVEVPSALRRRVLRREMSARRAVLALEAFAELRLRRYPHVHLLGRIWELHRTLTAYDATYVALAEALDCPLVTTDHALGQAAGHRAGVEAFPG